MMKKKERVIILLLLLACGVLFGCGKNKNEDYRQIQIYKIDGTAKVERQGRSMEAYHNMQLQSGDMVETIAESYVQLKLDEDKYILLEPDTKISLQASGNKVDSKTSIYLEKGAIVNQIDNPLSENSSYEVTTSNSTMAVRGTTFRVELTYDEKTGSSHTMVGVYGGKVESQLIFPDGTVGKPVMVDHGNQVLIRGDETDTEYVITENVNYEDLEDPVYEFLGDVVNRGKEISITKEELKEFKENAGLKRKDQTEENTEVTKNDEKKENEVEEEVNETQEEEKVLEFEKLESSEPIIPDEILEIPTLKEDSELEEDVLDDFYLTDDSEPDKNSGDGSGSSGSGSSGSSGGEKEETKSRTIVISFYNEGVIFATKEETVDNTATSITVSKPVLQPFEGSADEKGWKLEESTDFWIDGFDSGSADYPYVFVGESSETITFKSGESNLNINFKN